MDTTGVMRHMVARSGKSAIRVSRDLGRGDTFVTCTITRGSRPRVRLRGRPAGQDEDLSLSDLLAEG